MATVEVMVAVIAAVVVVSLAVRLLTPVLFEFVRRAYRHGPAPAASPGGTGNWFGWVVSLLWSTLEHKREEHYEYFRPQDWHTAPEPEIIHPPIDLPPNFPVGQMEPSPPAPCAHDEVLLSPDAQWWWDGRHWVDAAEMAPPGAVHSSDGTRWWDGARWRPVPDVRHWSGVGPSPAPGPVPAFAASSWLNDRGTAHDGSGVSDHPTA